MTVRVPTEIFSRVSGYYRPVQDWHDGKRMEFKQRAKMAIPSDLDREFAKPLKLGNNQELLDSAKPPG